MALVDTFHASVRSLFDPNSSSTDRCAADRWLQAWMSDFGSLTTAIWLIERSLDLPISFMACKGLEKIIEEYHDDMSVEEAEKVELGLVTRLRSKMKSFSLNDTCRNQYIRTLALLAVHFPDYVDRWNEFGKSVTVPFFARLFDYWNGGNADNITDTFRSRMIRYTENRVLYFLKEHQSEITSDWLVLANNFVLWGNGDGFAELCEFADQLSVVVGVSDMFPAFYNLFKTLTDFDVENMSTAEKYFAEKIMQYMIQTADNLRDEQMPLAMFIFGEVFDFWALSVDEWGRRDFALNTLALFNGRMKEFSAEPHEFISISEPMCNALGVLASTGDVRVWLEIRKFMSNMIAMINHNAEGFANSRIAAIFHEISRPYADTPSESVIQFFAGINEWSFGYVFALSSTHISVSSRFVTDLCSRVLSEETATAASLYFVRKCLVDGNDPNAQNMLEFVYTRMAHEFDDDVGRTLVSITRRVPGLFIEHDNDLIRPLIEISDSLRPNYFHYMIKVMRNIMYADHIGTVKARLLNAVRGVTTNILNMFIANDDMEALFRFIGDVIRGKKYDAHLELYQGLFDDIAAIIGTQLVLRSAQIVESMCEWFCDSLDAGIVRDVSKPFHMISQGLTAAMVPCWFVLLNRIMEDPANHTLLEYNRSILQFAVTGIGRDNTDVDVAIHKFMLTLIRNNWPPFFDVFAPVILTASLRSSDANLVECGLLVVEAVALAEPMRATLHDTVRTIIHGMLDHYTAGAIASSVAIIIKIVRDGRCAPQEMIQMVREAAAPQINLCQFESAFMSADAGAIALHNGKVICAHRKLRPRD